MFDFINISVSCKICFNGYTNAANECGILNRPLARVGMILFSYRRFGLWL
jgi:hypothetical protein